MEDIKRTAAKFVEFDNHEKVIRLENRDLGVVGFIAIHRLRGSFPSLGATRLWAYSEETEAMRDALRLSKLMSCKSVFADLPYGGAKAALMVGKNTPRQKLFTWYAEKLNALQGQFITGSDVGVEETDVSLMRQHTPYVIGDNVPAAFYTALGVLNSIRVVLKNMYGSDDVAGRTFAIQGLGKTGYELAKQIHSQGGRIVVSDIDPARVSNFLKAFPGSAAVLPEEIHRQNVDVFCPCALSYSLNSKTVLELQCKAIAGSANNQMESDEIEQLVYQKHIFYAVDYVANNGGLISVVDQYENQSHDHGRIVQKLSIAKSKLENVFKLSHEQSVSPLAVADRYVESILNANVIYDVSR